MTSHDRNRDRRSRDWTREESRWVDGTLDEPAARRLLDRLAEDPERAARLRAYRDAMDLWRDDTDRVADGLDTGRLADQVLAGRGLAAERDALWARRYAAAAVLLIGLGLAGASTLDPRRGEAGGAAVQTALQLIERDRLDLQTVREWETFPHVRRPGSGEER